MCAEGGAGELPFLCELIQHFCFSVCSFYHRAINSLYMCNFKRCPSDINALACREEGEGSEDFISHASDSAFKLWSIA